MRTITIALSAVSLLLTLVPSFLVFSNTMTLEQCKTLMLIGTIGWFITAPYWMKTRSA